MRSISLKLLTAILCALAAATVLIIATINTAERSRENDLIRQRGAGLTELLVTSVAFVMGQGIPDVSALEQDLRAQPGIADFRLVPSPKLGISGARAPDGIEEAVLRSAKESVERERLPGTSEPVLRSTRPLIAREACLGCHTQLAKGEPMAAMTLLLSLRESEIALRRFLLTEVGLMAAAVVLLLLGLWITVRRIVVRPVAHLRDLVKDVAEGEGDLRKRLTINARDEIGQTAIWTNTFLDRIRSIVVKIRDSSLQNESISGRLFSSLAQSTQSARQIAENIRSIRERVLVLNGRNDSTSAAVSEILATIVRLADQIQEQSSHVTETSAAIEEIDASINNVSRLSQLNVKTIENLLRLTEEGDGKVKSTNENISIISKNVDDLSEAISLIEAITSKTNLLSMNASIEAAHAGELGKGFAVVAAEIRSLAQTTGENAKRISASLKSTIQKIGESLESSTQSGTAFSQIQRNVRDFSNSLTEMANNTAELKNASGQILIASTNLLHVTETIRSQSQEIKTRAEEIDTSAREVKEISGSVMDGVSSISEEAVGIESESRRVEELSRESGQYVKNLMEEIRLFTTD